MCIFSALPETLLILVEMSSPASPDPLFNTSAHLMTYRGAETGMAALLTLTHPPLSCFMRSKFCSELKHRGNGSLFYHSVTSAPTDQNTVGKSFI